MRFKRGRKLFVTKRKLSNKAEADLTLLAFLLLNMGFTLDKVPLIVE
jgi:hypothetical protein